MGDVVGIEEFQDAQVLARELREVDRDIALRAKINEFLDGLQAEGYDLDEIHDAFDEEIEVREFGEAELEAAAGYGDKGQ